MRVFLAGASGVIGQRLIPRLVRAGHVVGGMTRSRGKLDLLSQLGAQPILCDVFDREKLIQAVRDFKPDVILNELTDLPDDVTKIGEHAELNARIRTEGNQNLINAARQSGAARSVGREGRSGRRKSWRKRSPGNYPMVPMPTRSQNCSARFLPRAAWC